MSAFPPIFTAAWHKGWTCLTMHMQRSATAKKKLPLSFSNVWRIGRLQARSLSPTWLRINECKGILPTLRTACLLNSWSYQECSTGVFVTCSPSAVLINGPLPTQKALNRCTHAVFSGSLDIHCSSPGSLYTINFPGPSYKIGSWKTNN